MDTRAEDAHPSNTTILNMLLNANVPMRERVASGILHWKMVMCASQGTVEFSGANFTGASPGQTVGQELDAATVLGLCQCFPRVEWGWELYMAPTIRETINLVVARRPVAQRTEGNR